MTNQTILLNLQQCKLPQIYTAVRFFRRYPPPAGKPAIAPPRGRKLTTAHEKDWYSPEDAQELLFRRQVYNNVLKSMRRVFKEDYEDWTQNKLGYGFPKIYADERAELDQLISEQNEQVRKANLLREQRSKENFEKLHDKYLKSLEVQSEKEAIKEEERTQIVLKQIKNSKHFLTYENMEEEIERALENPVVLDYCIDLAGKKYYDPPPQKYPLSDKDLYQTKRRFDRTLGPRLITHGAIKKMDELRDRMKTPMESSSETPSEETTTQPRGRFARFEKSPVKKERIEKAVQDAIDMATSGMALDMSSLEEEKDILDDPLGREFEKIAKDTLEEDLKKNK